MRAGRASRHAPFFGPWLLHHPGCRRFINVVFDRFALRNMKFTNCIMKNKSAFVTGTLACIALLVCCTSVRAQYSWRLILPKTALTVQVNSLDANKLYVGTRYDQIWRSNDAGTSWERL